MKQLTSQKIWNAKERHQHPKLGINQIENSELLNSVYMSVSYCLFLYLLEENQNIVSSTFLITLKILFKIYTH